MNRILSRIGFEPRTKREKKARWSEQRANKEKSKKNGALGGIASGVSRRRKRSMREVTDIYWCFLLFLIAHFCNICISLHNVLHGIQGNAIDFCGSVIAAQLHAVSNDFLFLLICQPCSRKHRISFENKKASYRVTSITDP